ncbi:MAG: glycosyltransferase family 2 protein [bacterium]|nr:glycosyltransferase family 2 protein [bacterium]
MTEPRPDLSLIVPCYNETPHLERSVRELLLTLRNWSGTAEVLFIDDASRDGTPQLIERLLADVPEARAQYHETNVGRGGTVSEGLRLARGRVAGFIDIDLEIHCRYIPAMVQAILDEGYDVATAHRVYKMKFTPTGILRWVLSVGYRGLARAMLGSPFRDTETGYKFFRREAVLPVLDRCRDRHWFWDTEVMLEAHAAGLKVIEIPALFQRQPGATSSLRVVPDTLSYLGAVRAYRRRRARGDGNGG